MVIGHCVVCNKYVPIHEQDNHKCSKRVEAGHLAAQRRYSGYTVDRPPSFNQRLADGFQLIRGNDQ